MTPSEHNRLMSLILEWRATETEVTFGNHIRAVRDCIDASDDLMDLLTQFQDEEDARLDKSAKP